jgi:hypothetical protein
VSDKSGAASDSPDSPWPPDAMVKMGQRVEVHQGETTVAPAASGHTATVLTEIGHTGVVVGGESRVGDDSSEIQFARIKWEPQAWRERGSVNLVELGSFESTVHLDFLSPAKDGAKGHPNVASLQAQLDAAAAEFEAENAVTECPEGGCEIRCAASQECRASCDGGGCTQICDADAFCKYECNGGKCRQECAVGSGCRLSCTPKDCTREFGGSVTTVDDTKPMFF